MKGKILFREEQSFVGTWMWYLVIGITLVALVPIFITFSNQPGDTDTIVGLAIVIVVMGGVLSLLTFSKLYLTIDSTCVYYRYPPFVSKEQTLARHDITFIEVRKYQPIWEYGGYGYRISPKSGRAMNVAGDQGLQLILTNKKKILIGTQKPDQLRQAVATLQRNWENTDQDA
jgi:Na+/melibiose symporter-like transporter